MAKRCPKCDLKYERAPGYFLGSTYVNYALTSVITTVAYVVLHFIYRVPNTTITPPLLLFVAVFPFVFFRYARSLWLSIDCFLDTTGVHTGIDEHLHQEET